MRELLIVSLLFASCASNTSDEVSNTDTTIQVNEPERVILLERDNVIVWGDDTVGEFSVYDVEVKFEPYISFTDFEAKKVFEGKRASLKLKKGDEYWSYRTRIRDGYKEPVNFAGHYCFVYWGCGSPCQAAVIIDVETGKIYDAPGASLGYMHFEDSRMLIVNPPHQEGEKSKVYGSSNGFYLDCAYCHPFIFIWNEELKQFEERKPMAY